jgi:DNA-binding response OmpR family regulator
VAGEPLAAGPAPAPAPGPVLLIDDDPTLLEALSRILVRDGFEARTAQNGLEGLRMARECRPSLIVLDVMMPLMDGWEVLKAFKADPALASIPVVMLTILDQVERGLALGAAEFLFKPIDRAQLSGVLQKFRVQGAVPRILVVGGDGPVHDTLQKLQALEGWESRPVPAGAGAAEILAQPVPGLVLLDLEAPGLEASAFLAGKQRNPGWAEVPVIAVSARDLSRAEREELGRNQVAAVLNKGHYTGDDLFEEVQRALRRGVGPSRERGRP